MLSRIHKARTTWDLATSTIQYYIVDSNGKLVGDRKSIGVGSTVKIYTLNEALNLTECSVRGRKASGTFNMRFGNNGFVSMKINAIKCLLGNAFTVSLLDRDSFQVEEIEGMWIHITLVKDVVE